MELPQVTRLRYVSARTPQEIVEFVAMLPSRIQIYGSPVYSNDAERWFLWFVPDDRGIDIVSQDL